MAVPNIEALPAGSSSWCEGLPNLEGERVTLRELEIWDAPALFRTVCIPEVTQQMWPPPPTVEAVQRFIERTRVKRSLGQYICFGVVPRGETEIAGLFELRPLQPKFFRIELGYFLHPAWWGTGVFAEAFRLVQQYSFDVLGVQRIEARVSVENPRGNAALRKLGARREGRLRAAFVDNDRYIDQFLYAIVNKGTQRKRPARRSK